MHGFKTFLHQNKRPLKCTAERGPVLGAQGPQGEQPGAAAERPRASWAALSENCQQFATLSKTIKINQKCSLFVRTLDLFLFCTTERHIWLHKIDVST